MVFCIRPSMPRYQNQLSVRRIVEDRASNRCEYCLAPDNISSAPFQVEHIVPSSKGGANSLDNFAWSCGYCNGAKGIWTSWVDPETREVVDLFHPRSQRWGEHFQFSLGNILLIEGITTVRRATVALLNLNRVASVALRGILMRDGQHPPVINASAQDVTL